MIRKCLMGVGAAVLVAGCATDNPFRTEAELAQKNNAPLATTVTATVAKDAVLRAGPDAETQVLHQVPAGTVVTASETVARGYRRVTTADGKSGFMDARALELGTGGGSTAAPAAR
jgi:hypothetical protein